MKDVVFVAVSVDSNKALVQPFVEMREFGFKILLSDGLVENAYNTGTLPQTYIIDANGQVRFHRTGFQTTHFEESLLWMIEGARVRH